MSQPVCNEFYADHRWDFGLLCGECEMGFDEGQRIYRKHVPSQLLSGGDVWLVVCEVCANRHC